MGRVAGKSEALPQLQGPPNYPVRDWRSLPDPIASDLGRSGQVEEDLRRDGLQRDKNAIVAYSLLPIFENDPTVWNAIRRLPESSAMFREYMLEWHAWVGPTEKPLVKRILGALRLDGDSGAF